MSFERYIFDSLGAAVEGISTVEPEEGYSIMLTDLQTVSRWVETSSFSIDIMKTSKQQASDLKDGIYDALDNICSHTAGILTYDINSLSASRDDIPGRWLYTIGIAITHRRDCDWRA